MSLILTSTTPELNERLTKLWKDKTIDVAEHLELRKRSDLAVDSLKNVEAFSAELKAVQDHADGLVSACMKLSKAVYAQNIAVKKQPTTDAELADELQKQDDLVTALESAPVGESEDATAMNRAALLIKADAKQRQAMQNYRETMIQAVEYQIAYVVAGAEATIGKLKI